jgi:hypothetical protein
MARGSAGFALPLVIRRHISVHIYVLTKNAAGANSRSFHYMGLNQYALPFFLVTMGGGAEWGVVYAKLPFMPLFRGYQEATGRTSGDAS